MVVVRILDEQETLIMAALECIFTVLACIGMLSGVILHLRYGTDRRLSITAKAIRMGGTAGLAPFSLLLGIVAWTGWNWKTVAGASVFVLVLTIVFSIGIYLRLWLLEAWS
jgi:hypothetical protein